MSGTLKPVRQAIIGAAAGAVIGLALTAKNASGLSAITAIPFFSLDRALLEHRNLVLAAAAGWVLLSLYWTVSARNATAAARAESKASRAVHVVLTNLALLLEIAPIHGVGRFLPVSAAIMVAGLAVEFAGLLFAIWARRHLGEHWSGEITIKQRHDLIRSGPYRRLRHPIYTGFLMMYAGVALVTGEWLAVVGFAMVLFAYWRNIRLEERNLDEAFGSDYAAYRHESWAIVPGVF